MDDKKDWKKRHRKTSCYKAWRFDRWEVWLISGSYVASRGHKELGVYGSAGEAVEACKEDRKGPSF